MILGDLALPANIAALYFAHLRHVVRVQDDIKGDVVDDERVVDSTSDSLYGVWKRPRQSEK